MHEHIVEVALFLPGLLVAILIMEIYFKIDLSQLEYITILPYPSEGVAS